MKGRWTKKRKLLHELAASKYLEFELEREREKRQPRSIVKCGPYDGHGSRSELSGPRTEDKMIKNVFEMEIPQALDRLLICKPEWQALWRRPCSFARPLEVGAFKKAPGQPPQPTRDPPPVLQATPAIIGTDLNDNVDAVQPTQKWDGQGTEELKCMLQAFAVDLDREGTSDDPAPSPLLLPLKSLRTTTLLRH